MSKYTAAPWPQPDMAAFNWTQKTAALSGGVLSIGDYIRAKACVDACNGIPTQTLTLGGPFAVARAAITQRDELAKALRALLDSCNGQVPLVQFGGDPTQIARDMNRARQILSEAA
ncbi:MAG TPA: hypothetical protein VFZ38_10640 [Vicinamibacterales bacterium]